MLRIFTPKDFDKICRTCQQIKDIMTVFNKDIINTLESFTNIKKTRLNFRDWARQKAYRTECSLFPHEEPQVANNSSLPNQICEECLEKANDCMAFKKQCEDSEQSLLNILDKIEDKNWISDDLKANYNEFHISRTVEDLNIKQEIDEKRYSCNQNKLQESLIDYTIPLQDISTENEDEETYPCDNNIYATESNPINFKITTNTLILNLSQSRLSMRRARIEWVKNLDPEKCDINKLLCKICEKTLINISSLARHMETHDKNRKFLVTCHICHKGFYENGNYKKHLQRHKRETRYECDKCSKCFYELNTLSTHLRKTHNVQPLQCSECNKEFIIEKQLNLHLKKHRNEFEHRCSYCGKGYFLMRRLKEHMLTHQKTYLCEICNKTYKNYTSLKGHNDRYHKSAQLKQDCEICGKTVLHMKAHMLVHNGARTFKCTDCTKSFLHRSDLAAHCKRKHSVQTNSDDPPTLLSQYLCNICGKRKVSKSALDQHIIHAHTTEKTQKCHLCEKIYKTVNALQRHVRFSHKDERHYKCVICAKEFYTNAILRIHMRTHTGERPYQCLICKRSFVQSSTLKTHLKVHTTADYDQ